MSAEQPPSPEQVHLRDWVLGTNLEDLESREKDFNDLLLANGWNDEAEGLIVGLREAVLNAMIHGNYGLKSMGEHSSWRKALQAEIERNPINKKVHIHIEVSPRKVLVRVKDEGQGFNPSEVKDPTQGEALFENSGRGLIFMKMDFDSVTFNEIGNEVTMFKTKSIS